MQDKGTLVTWNEDRGFGFIRRDDGSQIFVHASALPDRQFPPAVGTSVSFSVIEGRDGREAAGEIKVI